MELQRQATKEGAVELLGTRDLDSYALQEEHQRKWNAWGLANSYLNDEIDHTAANVPLAWQAFLTGLVDMLLYSRSQVWLGFQTGNMVSSRTNIAQFIIPGVERQPLLTLLRILSVIGFFLGSLTGFQLGRRIGHQKRSWLILSSVIHLPFRRRGHPAQQTEERGAVVRLVSRRDCAGGLLHGHADHLGAGARLASICHDGGIHGDADPDRLRPVPLPPGAVGEDRGRDRRMLAVLALFVGAGVDESLLHTSANLSGGIAIGAGFKLVLALLWLVPEGQKSDTAKASKA